MMMAYDILIDPKKPITSNSPSISHYFELSLHPQPGQAADNCMTVTPTQTDSVNGNIITVLDGHLTESWAPEARAL